MVDFFSIQNSTENPTLLLIIYTVLFSFLLSSLIAFTYEKTSREISKPMYFIQALVLLSIVTATVMQAIGDSVARGLGMLGALAVIRFRTTLRNPRNIVFMFFFIGSWNCLRGLCLCHCDSRNSRILLYSFCLAFDSI